MITLRPPPRGRRMMWCEVARQDRGPALARLPLADEVHRKKTAIYKPTREASEETNLGMCFLLLL